MFPIIYGIVPTLQDDKLSYVLEKLYNEISIIKYIQNHEFISDIKISNTRSLAAKDYDIVYLPENEFKLFILDKYHRHVFPIPCMNSIGLFRFTEIDKELIADGLWIKQLVNFFRYLSQKNIKVEFDGEDQLQPEYFLYNEAGKIECFLGFEFLNFQSFNMDLVEHNMKALARLLYIFYISVPNLYNKSDSYPKIFGRFVRPSIQGDSLDVQYNNFKEIITEIESDDDSKDIKTARMKVGLFLDVANILIGMGSNPGQLKIDFNKLLKRIYTGINLKRVKKVAVIFIPIYNSSEKTDKMFDKMMKIQNYLESYSFKVEIVENDTAKAKEVRGEVEYDVDDQLLIELMEKSIQEIDSLLLFSGDKHYEAVLNKYRNLGKEVKIVSLSENSTYAKYINDYDHYYITNFADCVEII